MRPVAGRLQLKAGLHGSWLIDDSYNANPSSVRAGIDVLCALPGEHWLVLGEMAELGDETVASHAGVGDYARRAGITRLFAMGAAARHAVDAFGARASWYADASALGDAVAGEPRAGRDDAREGIARQPPGTRRGAARRSAVRGRQRELRRSMLPELFDWLAQYYGGFRVFGYLTLRAIMAALTALTIALFVGPSMIRMLAARQIGQVVRDDGPGSHLGKKGTPTMGGALILIAVGAGTLLWADLDNRFVWIALTVTLAFGLIGFYDDYLKLVVRDPRGLAARWKYLWQSLAGLATAARAVADGGDAGGDRAVRAVLQGRRAADGRGRLRGARPTS